MCWISLALILVTSIALITEVNLCIILGGRDTMELLYIGVHYTAMVGSLISRCHNYHQSASIRVTLWNKFRNVPPVCCSPVNGNCGTGTLPACETGSAELPGAVRRREAHCSYIPFDCSIMTEVFSILIYIQQDATLHSLFYLKTALHVSGGTSTRHQERIQLYLQHLVFVTPLLLPAL